MQTVPFSSNKALGNYKFQRFIFINISSLNIQIGLSLFREGEITLKIEYLCGNSKITTDKG